MLRVQTDIGDEQVHLMSVNQKLYCSGGKKTKKFKDQNHARPIT